jgi:hypothetical protein
MESDPWNQWQTLAAAALASATGVGAAPGDSFAFAPFVEAAERFADAARTFHASASNSAPQTLAAARVFGDLLRDQFADVFKMPWGAKPRGSTAGPSPPEIPALGATREHQERLERGARAWRDMQDAQRRLQRLWSDTLREAASAFITRLGTGSQAPLTPDALNRLYDCWIDCAEAAYARTAHSDGFCDALADYVNASSRWRREFSAAAELWAKSLDLPTRSEVNTLAQRIRTLEERIVAGSGSQSAPSDPRPGGARKPKAPVARKKRRGPRETRTSRPSRQ